MVERTAEVDAQISKLRGEYLDSNKELLENVKSLIEISLKLTNKVLTLEERLDRWVKLAFSDSKRHSQEYLLDVTIS